MSRWSAPLLALALAGTLAGCSGDASTDVARPAPTTTFTAEDVPVIVPGAPDESPKVLQPGETGSIANAAAYRDEDVAFMTDMVGHHAQALRMAQLAPERAKDERVKRLAERIAAGQGAEIDAMQRWLEAQGLPRADEQASEHSAGHEESGTMPGMPDADDMTRLVAAKGTAFDRLFLELMVRHHEGALAMAEQAVGASHPVVSEQVDETVATQSVEISRMQAVLADLPA